MQGSHEILKREYRIKYSQLAKLANAVLNQQLSFFKVSDFSGGKKRE